MDTVQEGDHGRCIVLKLSPIDDSNDRIINEYTDGVSKCGRTLFYYIGPSYYEPLR